MKVLFHSINNMWAPHFEIELELMLKHKHQGDEVFVLTCQGILPRCSSNAQHSQTACMKCRSRFRQGMTIANIPASNIFSIWAPQPFPAIPNVFQTLDELQSFTLDGVEFGSMVASTIISDVRDHKFDTVLHAKKVYTALRTAIITYHAADETIKKLNPDTVYIFNGRVADVAPVVTVCQKLTIPFIIHERGGTIDTYSLFPNGVPHCLAYTKKLMADLWHDEALQDKKNQAVDWFIQRRAGVEQSWFSYTDKQTKGLLPAGFDHTKKNIALFNSSLDEYIMYPEWQNPLFDDENKAIEAIFQYFQHDPSLHFYLRIHPNLKKHGRSQMQELDQIIAKKYPNVTVIPPGDVIDSYALLEACDRAVVFASTIGVEACFWGKPAILIGRAYYEDFDCCYIPQTQQEAMDLIAQDVLLPKNEDNALPYAYWDLFRGFPFTYFKPRGLFQGAFMGQELRPKFGLKEKILFRIYNRLEQWR